MGKIIVSAFMTLDGVIEGPGGVGDARLGQSRDWSALFFGKETVEFQRELVFGSDALLMGRGFYLKQSISWPFRSDELADHMNNVPKYVVSRNLEGLGWNNAQLIGGNIEKRVRNLKRTVPRGILVCGGSRLVHLLRRDGLIDEYRILMHPLVQGSGKRLFPEEHSDGGSTQLKLREVWAFDSGVVALTYSRPERAQNYDWSPNIDFPI